MSSDTAQHGISVEFWVRAHIPCGAHDRCQTVLTRLQRLDEDGTIADFSVNRWGTRIDVSPSVDVSASSEETVGVHETITTFEEWADRNGVTLQPAFENRVATSLVTNEVRDVITVPVMCLAVYSGGELRGVFPCSDDSRVYTIDDCLTALKRDDDRSALPGNGIRSPTAARGEAS